MNTLSVATVDVSSGFLYNPMDPKYPKVHMILRVKLAELMVKVDPKLYRKIFITYSKRRMIFYV